ncbi:STAS domain-containing protein [Sphingomonas sp. 1P06PA]|uniref:STAS domain-containing protein n=1 Tax=Sphingomonas sp. 1P06PA TaxID=554121 RepID=UPI0039A55F90
MRQITLLANLDREGVRLMASELRDLIDRGDPIMLDASKVERVGLPAIQLLLSAMRNAAMGEPDVRLVAASDELRQAASLAGVDGLLGLTENC